MKISNSGHLRIFSGHRLSPDMNDRPIVYSHIGIPSNHIVFQFSSCEDIKSVVCLGYFGEEQVRTEFHVPSYQEDTLKKSNTPCKTISHAQAAHQVEILIGAACVVEEEVNTTNPTR